MFDRWSQEKRLALPMIMTVDDDDPLVSIIRERGGARTSDGLFATLLGTSRWVLFVEADDGSEALEFVGYVLDPKTAELVLQRGLQLCGFDDDEDLKKHLTLVMAEGIPIITETASHQARLDSLTREVLSVGFKVEEGGTKHLRYTPGGERVDVADPMALASWPSPLSRAGEKSAWLWQRYGRS